MPESDNELKKIPTRFDRSEGIQAMTRANIDCLTIKERYLRNELQTMSILGALGRSRTYLKSVSEEDKKKFRDVLRIKIDEISKNYQAIISEQDHVLNIIKLSDELTSLFPHCLINGRFRIGIAQKALNLYLKYLWCLGLIARPPHCPFDSVVISHLPSCRGLNWTSIDTIEEYQKLVTAAVQKANGKPIAKWELELWMEKIQIAVMGPILYL